MDGLWRMSIASLTDTDIAAYRTAITRTLPGCEPDTIIRLGLLVQLLDEETALRALPPWQEPASDHAEPEHEETTSA